MVKLSPPSGMSNFVPKCLPLKESAVVILNEFINKAKTLFILTGAGLSTESGIPDYRSHGVGLYAKSNRRPVEFRTFVNSEEAQRRYWARNFVAWPQFSSFQPNVGHHILADWEKKTKFHHLVTQNVDRLHTKAGSEKILELHGTTHKVVCLGCGDSQSRFILQDELMLLNHDWLKTIKIESVLAPDGDILLSDEDVCSFQIPRCKHCSGLLKPEVVFFGENIPKKVAERVNELVEECDSMLVIGSSLFVYSGYRLALKCKQDNKKLAILNIGTTRADDLADLKIEARCGDILPLLQFT